MTAACSEQEGNAPLDPGAVQPHFERGGISGYSGAPGDRLCSACHDADAGAAAPTVTLSGPTSVAPGATNTYTLEIVPAAGSNQQQGGLNVAAPDGGTLIAGSGTRLESGEIVHSSPEAGSGTLSWDFEWQAPQASGTYNMYGIGLSSDGSGTRGDEENTAVLAISVEASGNQMPTADPKSASTELDVPVAIMLSGSDAETCELGFSIVSQPRQGSLGEVSDQTCAGVGAFTDQGLVTYTPDPNFVGSDQFTYRVTDEGGLFDKTVVEITVNGVAATDYDLVRLRVRKDKSDKLVAMFSIKSNPRTPTELVPAELYVDDPNGAAAPVCTMMVSDPAGKGATTHRFEPAMDCDYLLSGAPPVEYTVTVRLVDANPDVMSKTLRVRRFATIVNIIDMLIELRNSVP
jgi:hypothetical protein